MRVAVGPDHARFDLEEIPRTEAVPDSSVEGTS
jgi:hypothetical protein